VAIDFFVVPTLTFRLLFGFVVLHHERRELLHLGVTDRPTAAWATQQIVDALTNETGPAYLLRDRDAIYSISFERRVERMGIRQVVIAPRAPWQNPYAERVTGSIRRECLDLVIVLNERHLRRLLRAYLEYYNHTRPHQSLGNDSPRDAGCNPSPPGRSAWSRRLAAFTIATSAPPDHPLSPFASTTRTTDAIALPTSGP
jgi:transposase InsO family protein